MHDFLPIAFSLHQGRINHSGPHTNVRQGPFSHTATHNFFSRQVYFSSPKKLTTFFYSSALRLGLHTLHTFKRQHSVEKFGT